MLKEKIVGFDGFVTFWTCSQHFAPEPFSTKMKELGLEKYIPEPMRVYAALRTALGEVIVSREVLIRPLGHKAGFALIKEIKLDNMNDYNPDAIITFGDKDTLQINVMSSDETYGAFAHDLNEAYTNFMGKIHTLMLSHQLARIVDHLNGFALRPEGGSYWVPGAGAETWEKVSDLVTETSSSNLIYRIGHSFDPDSVKAVQTALCRDIQKNVDEIWESIRSGNELSVAQREKRKEKISSLRVKILAAGQAVNSSATSIMGAIDEIEQVESTSVLID